MITLFSPVFRRRTYALGLILVVGLSGCSGKASKTELEPAVRRLLAENGAPAAVYGQSTGADSDDYARCMNASIKEYGVRMDVRDVRILEIEDPWLDPGGPTYNRHYQAKVWIEGECLENGKRLPFQGTTEVEYDQGDHSKVWWWH